MGDHLLGKIPTTKIEIAMSEKAPLFYEFGPFRLDPIQRTLHRDGDMVALAPKVLETLVLLLQHSGKILEKEEMIHTLWPESFVEEGNLSQNIFVLRNILSDDRNGHTFIQTIPRRGYRFVAAVKEIDGAITPAPPPAPASGYWSKTSPFRSLQVFEAEDSWLFFGRETETQDLLARLDKAPVLALVGNSGSGKSSILRAGLVPALHDGQFRSRARAGELWRIAVLRPSSAPFDFLAEVLPKQLAPGLTVKEQAEFIAECREKLPRSRHALRDAISALANASGDLTERVRILIVVDQFEEVFTLNRSPQLRERYIDALLTAAQSSRVPVNLLLAIRSDFYAHCVEHPELAGCMGTSLYNLPRMTAEKLRESIEKRLQLAGASAEPGLIDSLLQDVGTEPGNLALLEHALGLLWEKCHHLGPVLTNHAYAEIGRLRGALGQHADRVYESLDDDRQKALMRKLFLELVHLGEGSQDTRQRLAASDLQSLGPAESIDRLMHRLVSSRLVSTGLEREEPFVEVSHEALIREWPMLREWLDNSREELALERQLRRAAQEWESLEKDNGALLRGARLAQGEEWLVRHLDASPQIREFLCASIEVHSTTQEQELAQQRELRSQAEGRAQAEQLLREQHAFAALQAHRSALRFRWFSVALTTLLLIAIGLAGVAYHESLVERSYALSARSGVFLARDHGRAFDLALRGWRTADNPETRIALAKAFPELMVILPHDGPVVRAAFSPDGQLLLGGGGRHAVRLWRVSDNKLLFSLGDEKDEVEDAQFSADGRRVVIAYSGQVAKVWDTRDGRLVSTLGTHKEKVQRFDISVAGRAIFSPDGMRVVTAGWDNDARIWNVASGSLVTTLQGHSGVVGAVAFAPDGKQIVTGSWDHEVRLWNSDGVWLRTLAGHDGLVSHVHFSPDGRRIISTSWDRTARLWSSLDGSLMAVLQHKARVDDAGFSPNGETIVTVSDDNTARTWTGDNGHALLTLRHDGPVTDAEFSNNGRQIITASNDRTARVWSRDDGRQLGLLEGHGDVVNVAAFSPDGSSIMTGSSDNTVRLWSTRSGIMVSELTGHGGPVLYAEFAPGDRHMLTQAADQTTRIWSVPEGKLQTTIHGSTGNFAHFSPDGKKIVAAGNGPVASIWDAKTGHLVAELRGHTNRLWQAAFSSDGERIVTASADHTAKIWDCRDGHLMVTLAGHKDEIYHASFSPDQSRIITASLDHTARLWDARDGRQLAVLEGHGGPVWRATFSPDGRRVVTASFDHAARVWDSADGRLVAILNGHSDIVDVALFSSDGRHILTASWDNTARIWSTEGHLEGILAGHNDKIISAGFSADAKKIVTASADHTARVWELSSYRIESTLSGHADQVWQAAFSADGLLILTASLDQSARLWRVITLDDLEAILKK